MMPKDKAMRTSALIFFWSQKNKKDMVTQNLARARERLEYKAKVAAAAR
jgi:hypothetical protein